MFAFPETVLKEWQDCQVKCSKIKVSKLKFSVPF